MIRKKRLKALFVASIMILTAVLSGCQSGKALPSISEIETSLTSEINTDSLLKLDDKQLERIVGITQDELEGYFMYISQSSNTADEVGIFLAKDDKSAKDIAKRLEDRAKSQKESAENYTPKAAAIYGDAVIRSKGNYVFYSASENAEKYEDAFKKNF